MLTEPLTMLFDQLRSFRSKGAPWKDSSSLAIYGAGGFGRSLGRALAQGPTPVSMYLDMGATPGQRVDGIPVLPPDSLSPSEWEGLTVIIGIHNPGVSVRRVEQDLRRNGCPQVYSPIHALNHLEPSFGYRYWLCPSAFYLEWQSDIASARDLLEPDSHPLFDAVLTQRLTGDYQTLPDPTHSLDDYLPADVEPFHGPVRIVDGGAYDGDTLRGLQSHGFRLESIAAFEPDGENFTRLASWVASQPDIKASLWPCGLYSHPTQVHFSAGQGEASAISAEGSTTIQCVSVDTAVHGLHPNLLKLDVEGAEPEALKGAKRTIQAYNPFIIAGLYHHPSHLWRVPRILKDLSPSHRLHLRLHAHNGFDLWLHAIPSRASA